MGSLSPMKHNFITKSGANNVAQYKLYYFPIRGRAQAISYLLKDNEIKYEWINVVQSGMEEWASKYKPMMIFGQCPMLEDVGNGDFKICQFNSILRYLGRKHGLYPDNIQDEARVDMIMDHVEDIRGEYVKLIYSNYDTGKEAYIKGLPDKLCHLEKLLKKNEYILSKVTMADYNLFDMLDDLLILASDCLKEFPTLQAFHTRMANRPRLKALRDTDDFKKTPVNGNDKQ